MGTSNLIINTGSLVQPWVSELKTRKRVKSSLKGRKKVAVNVKTVAKIISSIQPLPSQIMLLGECRDGLPFLMEIGDPEIGAVLVECDQGCGKTHQMQVMVDSALLTHTPHEMQVLILTLNPTEWNRYKNHPQYAKQLIGVHAWYDPRVEDRIKSLTELAEARRDGEQSGPSVLFILDDLNYVEDLSLEAQVNLRWLLAYGAQSNIWLVSSINAHLSQSFQYWIEPCRTRIFGRVESRTNTTNQDMDSEGNTTNLSPGEFMIQTGTNWMAYRLPLLGE